MFYSTLRLTTERQKPMELFSSDNCAGIFCVTYSNSSTNLQSCLTWHSYCNGYDNGDGSGIDSGKCIGNVNAQYSK
jgi:hypothetical protein